MTVEYSSKVATATGAIGFVRLLFRWTGSIYKVVWLNLLFYMMLFFFLSYLYHYVLDRGQQRIFEKVSVFCRRYVSTIPLSFILGFYVDIVMDRWWGQFTKIPWPDAVGFAVITSVKGTSEKSRLIRRTIMRYVNLAFVMTMQLCSPPCKERFPTWDHFVEAGFLLEQEKEIIEHLSEHTDEPKYWLPLAWAVNVAAKARKEDKIYDDISFCYLVKEVNAFRTKCQTILCYDWVCIPLVYTQVVTIACYLYFLCMVLARQFLESSEFVVGQEGAEFNVIFPFFLFVEFFFYFGWLNVAETLVNPFGSDDDDFEVNYLIDRHLKVSYAMVDDITSLMPEMAQDAYWNEKGGVELPYTWDQRRLKNRTETFQGSAAAEVVRGHGGSFVVDVTPDLSSKNIFGSGSLANRSGLIGSKNNLQVLEKEIPILERLDHHTTGHTHTKRSHDEQNAPPRLSVNPEPVKIPYKEESLKSDEKSLQPSSLLDKMFGHPEPQPTVVEDTSFHNKEELTPSRKQSNYHVSFKHSMNSEGSDLENTEDENSKPKDVTQEKVKPEPIVYSDQLETNIIPPESNNAKSSSNVQHNKLPPLATQQGPEEPAAEAVDMEYLQPSATLFMKRVASKLLNRFRRRK